MYHVPYGTQLSYVTLVYVFQPKVANLEIQNQTIDTLRCDVNGSTVHGVDSLSRVDLLQHQFGLIVVLGQILDLTISHDWYRW